MNRASLSYTWPNALRGLLIYAIGDTIAALILGQFALTRMMGIMLVGATVYAFEIPNYFHWIDTRAPHDGSARTVVMRTGLALAYFNPLWIARHLLFIYFFAGTWAAINWGILRTAGISFAVNIPIALIGNYIIQNKMPYEWRFFSSAVFSALMAIYYAVSAVVF